MKQNKGIVCMKLKNASFCLFSASALNIEQEKNNPSLCVFYTHNIIFILVSVLLLSVFVFYPGWWSLNCVVYNNLVSHRFPRRGKCSLTQTILIRHPHSLHNVSSLTHTSSLPVFPNMIFSSFHFSSIPH